MGDLIGELFFTGNFIPEFSRIIRTQHNSCPNAANPPDFQLFCSFDEYKLKMHFEGCTKIESILIKIAHICISNTKFKYFHFNIWPICRIIVEVIYIHQCFKLAYFDQFWRLTCPADTSDMSHVPWKYQQPASAQKYLLCLTMQQ